MGMGGAIYGSHTSPDILFKNDQNNKDISMVKDNLKFIFNRI